MSGRTRHPKKPRDVKAAARARNVHAKKPPIGRPTEYKPEYCREVKKLLMLKKETTDAEIAFYLGVSTVTLWTWKKQHPEFLSAIQLSRDRACADLVAKLYDRATGYSHPAVKIINTEAGVIEHPYTEHYPPDTAAAVFLLKNWRPAEFKDKQVLEHREGAAIPLEESDVAAIESELVKRKALPKSP